MDNLPKDPPPSFGSNFDPHTNPQDPNNPYQTQPPPITPDPSNPSYPPDHPSTYSEVASHKLRDTHGKFASDHLSSDPQTTLNSLKSPNIFKRFLIG